MADNVTLIVNETIDNVVINPSITTEVVDVNVSGTDTYVDIAVTPNLTTVNINQIAGVISQNLQEVTNVGSTTTNSITANSFVKSGGTSSQFLMANGGVTTGNGGVYSYEIHVSQVDGNDTTGTGAVLNPVASITKALTLITGERKTIIIHPGNYTENPSITFQYTVLTTYQATGGNTLITGTVTASTGCSISGLKMTNLTINAPTGTGNVNILNCDISGTLTRTNTGNYTLIRFCDIGVTNINSTSGTVAIFGGNPSFITVNNAGASVLVKNAVCISPVVLVGNATFADCILISTGPTTNALTSSAGTFITLANSQCVIPTFQNVSRVSLSGFYSILNCVYDKPNSTLVATSGTGGSTNSIDYFQFINADKFIKQGGTSAQLLAANGDSITAGTNITISNGEISSVGGIVSINGITQPTQTLAVGTTGTDFAINSSGSTHTFNLPDASASNRGALSSANWTTFNGKQDALGFTPYNSTNPSGYQTAGQVQTIADAKVADAINDGNTTVAPSQNAVFDALALKANDNLVVHLAGTETITGQKTFNPSVTAASLIARGTHLTPTLVASANSDRLVGLDIAPTFNNGAFTGVENIALRLNNLFLLTGPAASTNTYFRNDLIDNYSSIDFGIRTNTSNFYLRTGSTNKFNLFNSTGNLMLQNGGTFTDIASSRLTVNSTTQGILPPRMTTAQKNAIVSPVQGLTVYDTDLLSLSQYNGTAWIIYAPLASPTFTGTPLTTTPTTGDNTTKIASTAFVKTAVDSQVYNITIGTGTGTGHKTTESVSDVGGYSQNGRNVMVNNGATAIIITVNTAAATDFIASYTKLGTANITFEAGAGAILKGFPAGVEVKVINGVAGSTALLTRTGNTFYLQVNNLL